MPLIQFLYDSAKEIVHIYYIMGELTPFVAKIGEKYRTMVNSEKSIFSIYRSF